MPILKDAYLACASALKQLDPALSTGGDVSIQYAASAIKTLLSFPVSNSHDAIVCLTLGAALAISVSATVAMGVADICQYCLAATHPFIESAVPGSDMETWHGVLIWLETMDCLFKRRRPTVRPKPQDSKEVHRYLGLCLPLIPYYYDLCVISHSLNYLTDAGALAYLHRQLDVINTSVAAWTPSPGSDFIDQFGASEVVTLLAQARVYRLAALLVSHRLRYAFGEHDEQADIWSKEIMVELEVAQKIAGRPNRCVTLPFIIAAIEIRDPTARNGALQNTVNYVDNFSSTVHNAAKTFLCRVWRGRDLRTTSCWLDSIHKPCPVLQSINGTGVN
ncbi:hypothetical protein NPX13_g3836 [Xylaria arbuscula]|uniref:Uncharacterized protein n=1 Tax=Xylaria arbuscula TaxID=114810 RepID=A0A9W8NHP3_9PEZI|nr:hypothetical protein NPX13_g3836 [Xylaria arbuscula]